MNNRKSPDIHQEKSGFLRKVLLDPGFLQKIIVRLLEFMGVVVVGFFGWQQIFGSMVNVSEFLNSSVELFVYNLVILSCIALLGPIVAVVWILRKKGNNNTEKIQKLIPQITESGQKVLQELVVIETGSIRLGGRARSTFKKDLLVNLDTLEILTTRLSKTWGIKISEVRKEVATYNLEEMGGSTELRDWQKTIKELIKSPVKEMK